MKIAIVRYTSPMRRPRVTSERTPPRDAGGQDRVRGRREPGRHAVVVKDGRRCNTLMEAHAPGACCVVGPGAVTAHPIGTCEPRPGPRVPRRPALRGPVPHSLMVMARNRDITGEW